MATLAEILKDRETKDRESARAKWARYAGLLASSNSGTLTSAEGDELAGLLKDLDLSLADAETHGKSLRNQAAAAVRESKIGPLEKEIEELNPQIETLAARRAELLAEIDGQLQPLLGRVAGLTQERDGHRRYVESVRGRELGRHPHLFGLGFDPPPAPVQKPTERQLAESNHRINIWSDWIGVRARLKGQTSRKGFSDGIQEAVTWAMRFGRETSPDPMVWSPSDGQAWPTIENGYPKELWEDPRRKEVLKRAREIKLRVKSGVGNEQGFKWSDVNYEGQAMLQLGVRMGWLDQSYDPAPNPDTDEPDSPAAPINAPPPPVYLGK